MNGRITSTNKNQLKGSKSKIFHIAEIRHSLIIHFQTKANILNVLVQIYNSQIFISYSTWSPSHALSFRQTDRDDVFTTFIQSILLLIRENSNQFVVCGL